MKPYNSLAALCLATLCYSGHAFSAETKAESIDPVAKPDTSHWAFGIQAAPKTFGLSLKYAINPQWAVQGVVSPDSSGDGLALRVLRSSDQSPFWKSYLFAGIAADSMFESDARESVATVGLGVEWSWQSKNPNHPPFFWSLEFGLGYEDDQEDEQDPYYSSEDDRLFLALGLGLHYHFK